MSSENGKRLGVSGIGFQISSFSKVNPMSQAVSMENRKPNTGNRQFRRQILRLLNLLPFYLVPIIGLSQPGKRPPLDFDQPGEPIAYRFDLSVSKAVANNLWYNSGKKYNLKQCKWTINGEDVEVKKTRTRGKSSLRYPRKGLNLSFDDQFQIEDVRPSKIALNNLAQDQNYWRNRFSYLLLSEIGIFPMFNQFAEMSINGRSQGIFLVVEKTDSYTKRIGVKLLVRRDENGAIRTEYNLLDSDKSLVKQFNRVEGLFSKYEGPSLYQEIEKVIDLDRYFRWLAVNHILRNGDYTDEAFFYYDQETSNFKLLAWDYDDIFSQGPHEGKERRNLAMRNRLLFSGEVVFDLKIDRNQFLYTKYLDEFEKTLDYFDEGLIKSLFDRVYSELKPFYQNPEIISMSQYDKFGLTDMETLQKDLSQHYHSLLNRCLYLRAVLKEERRSSEQ